MSDFSNTHTPGPWVVEIFNGEDATDGQQQVSICACADDDGKEGFSLAWCNTWMKINNPETLANARLIASAPDLLAACQTAKDAMTQEFLYQTGQKHRPAQNYPPQGTVDGALGTAMEAINAAIAKAKGGH